MELSDQFTVDLPVERAFELLSDVERIAPCLPGAELQEVAGEEFRGVVKVKVGPITAQYRGVARFLEQDKTAHRMVLRAEGRETRGQGNASATVTAELAPEGDSTRVSVRTDLTITGKVAQFGRGVLAEVSTKLLGQFVECLEATVLSEVGGTSDAPSPSSPTSGASGGAIDRGADAGGAGAAVGAGAAGAAAAVGAAAGVAADAGAAGAGAADAGAGTDAGAAGAGTDGSAPAGGGSHGSGPTAGEGDAEGAEPVAGHGSEKTTTEQRAPEGSASTVRPSRPVEPVDLMQVAGPSMLKRIVPLVAGLAALAAAVVTLKRRLRSGSGHGPSRS